jgi:basic membrane lipoprotein Med (substrate-binding protein (PBP1-ABC) superfamily)
MKKWIFATMVVLMALSLVLAGCAQQEEEGIKVGMVSDVGGVDDASFNQNTWASRHSSSRARPRRTMRRISPSSPSRTMIWCSPWASC